MSDLNEFCVAWGGVWVSLACSGDDLLEIGVGDFGDAIWKSLSLLTEFCAAWGRMGISMACSWDDLLEIGVGVFGDAFDGGVVGVVKLPCLSHVITPVAQPKPNPGHQGLSSWSGLLTDWWCPPLSATTLSAVVKARSWPV